jgi:hypothetical protein
MNSLTSSYYLGLSGGYAAALLGWLLISHLKPDLWGLRIGFHFKKPWLETLLVLVAAVGTLGIGRLYSAHWLFPESKYSFLPLSGIANQMLIFSPFILLIAVRRHPLISAWLPLKSLIWRLGIGLTLALAAITAFGLIGNPSETLGQILGNVYHPKNLSLAAQVFLEDFAIAIFFVRFRAAVGAKWFPAVVLTAAFLFAAAHYPQKISQGEAFWPATRDVLIDGALVSGAILVLQKSRDIVWFWCVHFAMDMMQFYSGLG